MALRALNDFKADSFSFPVIARHARQVEWRASYEVPAQAPGEKV
jgi:hypothetical protein